MTTTPSYELEFIPETIDLFIIPRVVFSSVPFDSVGRSASLRFPFSCLASVRSLAPRLYKHLVYWRRTDDGSFQSAVCLSPARSLSLERGRKEGRKRQFTMQQLRSTTIGHSLPIGRNLPKSLYLASWNSHGHLDRFLSMFRTLRRIQHNSWFMFPSSEGRVLKFDAVLLFNLSTKGKREKGRRLQFDRWKRLRRRPRGKWGHGTFSDWGNQAVYHWHY